MFDNREKSFISSCLSIMLVLCICVTMFCSFSITSFAASTTNTLKTITKLNLRKSASDSASVLKVIPKGASVTLKGTSSKGWAKVKYSSYTGYCSTSLLYPDKNSGVTITAKTKDLVNLRESKTTSSKSLALVPKSTRVTVKGCSHNEWVKAEYSSKTGYISKDYVVVTFYLAKAESSGTTTSPAEKPKIEPTEKPTVTPTEKPTVKPTVPASSTANNLKTIAKLNLRKSASNSAFVLKVVPKGATVKLLKTSSKGWAKVKYSSYTGYCSTSYLYPDKNSAVTITAKTKDLVNLRNSKSTSSKSLALIPKSTRVTVIGCSHSDWVKAKYSSKVGYISKKYVVVTFYLADTISSDTTTPTEKPTVAPTQKPTAKPTAKPTEAPTVKPTSKDTLSLSEKELRLYVGTQHILKAKSDSSVTWSTSNKSVATVSNGVVTFVSPGTATITAKTATKKSTCKVTSVAQKISINASHSSATVTAGKTFFARSTTPSVTWSSSDTSVATVNNGYIYGVSEGKAIIKIYKKGGTKTILVTVKKADPIRFAYTSPNCAPKNSDVTLIAVTDKTRTDVRFRVADGDTTKTVYATSKKSEGSTYVWKAKYKFTTAGTFKVKAHSKLKSKWTTCDDALTTAFVTSTSDEDTTACAQRRVSDKLINVIATFEGYMPSVYDDVFTGDPTLGYGKLVFVGEQFYNNLTKTEAYAYLAQTINNEGYSSKTNSFLIDNNVKFNQQQFDALVCFVYNTGTGVYSSDNQLRNAILDCNSTKDKTTKTYYINGSSVRIRKGPGTSHDIIKELSYGTTLKILKKTSSSWYYVQLTDGTKGYVSTDYIDSKNVSTTLDLKYVKKQNLINKICQYHHANGCIRGLLNRRIDEMEMFFYKDYDIDYGSNNYSMKFTCASNPSFHT